MAQYTQALAFWTPGPMELIIILILAVLIFCRRLPEIARGMGRSLTEFKKGLKDVNETKDEVVNDVIKAGNDVTDEAQKAAGLDELDS